VVPGVSGSFFLLAVGLYSTTLQALHNRDLGYIAIFAAGALLGLVTVVRLVRHLLRTHRRITLIAMAGLMIGSLRALWPWQTSASGDTHGVGVLLPPSGPVAVPLLLMGIGAVSVALLILVEARLGRAAPSSARSVEGP
jgi:putative membrane protein